MERFGGNICLVLKFKEALKEKAVRYVVETKGETDFILHVVHWKLVSGSLIGVWNIVEAVLLYIYIYLFIKKFIFIFG